MRAIAVLFVIVFHLEPAFLPGGFVGVDIFFVLSGYFITQLLVRDLADGCFSLTAFYARRIRRLFPALFAMLAATSLAAVMWLMPVELEAYGRHLIGAALSFSNLIFWAESGYFAPAAETLPLLHTWSLAVEEQFYLIFPICLWGIWRNWPRHLPHFIGAIIVLSFLLSVAITFQRPHGGFFLLPTRMWELAIGSFLAVGVVRPPQTVWLRQAAYAAGGLAIMLSGILFSSRTPFPGYHAALPCLGTALVIWAGARAKGCLQGDRHVYGLIGGCLAARPAVFVGLISYSLYLWHWPMIVFTEQLTPGPATLSTKLLLLPLIGAVAYLSWRFIEQPFRAPRFHTARQSDVIGAGLKAAAALSLTGIVILLAEGFPEKVPQDAYRLSLASQDSSPIRAACHADGHGQRPFSDMCRFGPDNGRPVYVYADSHGAEISYALSERADALNIKLFQLTASACPPAQMFLVDVKPGCAQHNRAMLEALEAAKPGTVLLAADFFKWQAHQSSDVFWEGLSQTLGRLHATQHDIVLLGPLPTSTQGELPDALAKWTRSGRAARDYDFLIDTHIGQRVDTRLKDLIGRFGLSYLDQADLVCGARDRCPGLFRGHVLFFDDNHITVSAARAVVSELIAPHLRGAGVVQ